MRAVAQLRQRPGPAASGSSPARCAVGPSPSPVNAVAGGAVGEVQVLATRDRRVVRAMGLWLGRSQRRGPGWPPAPAAREPTASADDHRQGHHQPAREMAKARDGLRRASRPSTSGRAEQADHQQPPADAGRQPAPARPERRGTPTPMSGGGTDFRRLTGSATVTVETGRLVRSPTRRTITSTCPIADDRRVGAGRAPETRVVASFSWTRSRREARRRRAA